MLNHSPYKTTVRKKPTDRLVTTFIYTSYDNKILEKVLEPGDAEEEMVNAFHISLKRSDFWLLHETQWINDKVRDI